MYNHKNNDKEIIMIIGSVRFMDGIKKKAWEFTREGKIVLLPNERPEECTDADISILEDIGFAKIDLADRVFCYNEDDYIGESTSKEVAYARFIGKPIEYLVPQEEPEPVEVSMDDKALIVVVGKTCSGKTTLVDRVVKETDYKKIVTYTTRPPRDGEDESSYVFVDDKEFQYLINHNKLMEYTSYDVASGETWYYGSAKVDYGPGKIIVLNPYGLERVQKELEGQHVVYIYLKASDAVLRARLEDRGDNNLEADRRLAADAKDFKGIESKVDFTFFNNAKDDIDEIVAKIKEGCDVQKSS